MAGRKFRAGNHLLNKLSGADFRLLDIHLVPVELTWPDVLSGQSRDTPFAYFPVSAVIAHQMDYPGGISLNLVGREGMIGAGAAAGIATPHFLLAVQESGTALRIDAKRLRTLAGQSASLQLDLHRYSLSLLDRSRRMSSCAGFHDLQSRVARCLLECREKSEADEFRLTQEQLANMIAGRRGGVSVAATAMRHKRLLEYSRGHVRVIDAEGLQRLACPCYSPPGSQTLRA